jgi:hypothetical protein
MPTAASAVFHNHRLAQHLLQMRRNRPRGQIRRGSTGESANDPHGPIRPSRLRAQNAWACGKPGAQRQKGSAIEAIHEALSAKNQSHNGVSRPAPQGDAKG